MRAPDMRAKRIRCRPGRPLGDRGGCDGGRAAGRHARARVLADHRRAAGGDAARRHGRRRRQGRVAARRPHAPQRQRRAGDEQALPVAEPRQAQPRARPRHGGDAHAHLRTAAALRRGDQQLPAQRRARARHRLRDDRGEPAGRHLRPRHRLRRQGPARERAGDRPDHAGLLRDDGRRRPPRYGRHPDRHAGDVGRRLDGRVLDRARRDRGRPPPRAHRPGTARRRLAAARRDGRDRQLRDARARLRRRLRDADLPSVCVR